ncbi:MAG: hypothetical protein Q9160_008939 [Pyrenula sp. 1 TL-2023]
MSIFGAMGSRWRICSEKPREALTKTVDLDDEHPYAVEGLLIFLYTASYPYNITAQKPTKTSEVAVALLQIADKRQAHGLRSLSIEQISFYLHYPFNGKLSTFIETANALRSMDIPIPVELRKEMSKFMAAAKLDQVGEPDILNLYGDEESIPRVMASSLTKRARESDDLLELGKTKLQKLIDDSTNSQKTTRELEQDIRTIGDVFGVRSYRRLF